MQSQPLKKWHHSHEFLPDTTQNEKSTLRVVLLTAVMMVGEIIGGWVFHSMALMADGFHMGTHAFALGVTLLAYWYARRNARNPTFTFGAGKVGDLGGFTSAILLLVVAIIMAVESAQRFLHPVAIRYTEAIIIAFIGLAINLASAWILRDHHDHDGHHHDEHEDHAHSSHDHNIKAAYLHVLADALTSVLAITALFMGMIFGWVWMDPIMGIVGSIVITRWSFGLLAETSGVLLDKISDRTLQEQIRSCLENNQDDYIYDLHTWEIGPGHYAVIASILTDTPQPIEHYKERLADIPKLAHITIEVAQREAS